MLLTSNQKSSTLIWLSTLYIDLLLNTNYISSIHSLNNKLSSYLWLCEVASQCRSLWITVTVWATICLRFMKYASVLSSLRLIAAWLSHHCDLVRFFAWHGIVCALGTSLVGRNMKACWVQYSFKICDSLTGCVDFDDAVKRYRCGLINDDCMRTAHFSVWSERQQRLLWKVLTYYGWIVWYY